MNSKQEMQTLIDYLENNKKEVLSFVRKNRGSFVMVGEFNAANVFLSTAQDNDHLMRTNILLGYHLSERELDEIIAREKAEMQLIPEGW